MSVLEMSEGETVTRRDGRVARILLWCCGADGRLDRTDPDQVSFYSLGLSVLLNAAVASAVAVLLLTYGNFPIAEAAVIGASVAWGAVVMFLDRTIVMPMRGRHGRVARLAAIGSRFMLALVISSMATVGIELALFETEIDRQVAVEANESNRDRIIEWQEQARTAEFAAREDYSVEVARPSRIEQALQDGVAGGGAALDATNRDFACEVRPQDFDAGSCQIGTGISGFGVEADSIAVRVSSASAELEVARQRLTDYTVTPVDITREFAPGQLQVCGFNRSITTLTPKDSDACTAALLIAQRVQQLAPAPTDAQNLDGPLSRISALSTLGSGPHRTTFWALGTLLLMTIGATSLAPLIARLYRSTTGHDVDVQAHSTLAS